MECREGSRSNCLLVYAECSKMASSFMTDFRLNERFLVWSRVTIKGPRTDRESHYTHWGIKLKFQPFIFPP